MFSRFYYKKITLYLVENTEFFARIPSFPIFWWYHFIVFLSITLWLDIYFQIHSHSFLLFCCRALMFSVTLLCCISNTVTFSFVVIKIDLVVRCLSSPWEKESNFYLLKPFLFPLSLLFLEWELYRDWMCWPNLQFLNALVCAFIFIFPLLL